MAISSATSEFILSFNLWEQEIEMRKLIEILVNKWPVKNVWTIANSAKVSKSFVVEQEHNIAKLHCPVQIVHKFHSPGFSLEQYVTKGSFPLNFFDEIDWVDVKLTRNIAYIYIYHLIFP